jgi:hypothetical protein
MGALTQRGTADVTDGSLCLMICLPVSVRGSLSGFYHRTVLICRLHNLQSLWLSLGIRCSCLWVGQPFLMCQMVLSRLLLSRLLLSRQLLFRLLLFRLLLSWWRISRLLLSLGIRCSCLQVGQPFSIHGRLLISPSLLSRSLLSRSLLSRSLLSRSLLSRSLLSRSLLSRWRNSRLFFSLGIRCSCLQGGQPFSVLGRLLISRLLLCRLGIVCYCLRVGTLFSLHR